MAPFVAGKTQIALHDGSLKYSHKIKDVFLRYAENYGNYDIIETIQDCIFVVESKQLIIAFYDAKKAENFYAHNVFVKKICDNVWSDKKFSIEYGLISGNVVNICHLEAGIKKAKTSKYVLDNFVVSESNSNAFNIIKDLSTLDGGKVFPGSIICINAKTGLGKTHLLKSLEIELASYGKKHICQTADEFTYDYLESYKKGSIFEFKKRIANVNYLLIDDYDGLLSRKSTFQNLVNAAKNISSNDGYVVLTCRDYNEEMAKEIGVDIKIDVHVPDEELIKKYFNLFITKNNLSLPISASDALLKNKCASVKCIQKYIKQMVAFQKTHNIEINGNIAHVASKPMMNIVQTGEETKYINAVMQFYNINTLNLNEEKRSKTIIKARCILIYLLKNNLNLSNEKIALILGYKNTSSVLSSISTIEYSIKTKNKQLIQEMLTIEGIALKS